MWGNDIKTVAVVQIAHIVRTKVNQSYKRLLVHASHRRTIAIKSEVQVTTIRGPSRDQIVVSFFRPFRPQFA